MASPENTSSSTDKIQANGQAPLLLIEDNAELVRDMAEYFRRRGRIVLPCATLAEARSALDAMSPGAVICDANMPDGSGLDFCIEVASRLQGCFCILISGAHDHNRLEEALAAGARFTVVDKPAPMRELRRLLETHDANR